MVEFELQSLALADQLAGGAPREGCDAAASAPNAARG